MAVTRRGVAYSHARAASPGPAAWDQPAPPEGWVARDVVRHLVDWFPAFLQEATGITLPAGPSVDYDPLGAWRTRTDAVQALLDDPATAERGARAVAQSCWPELISPAPQRQPPSTVSADESASRRSGIPTVRRRSR